MTNLFGEPKALKKWAVKLANACGGQTVERSLIIKPINIKKVDELIEQFVKDHNEMVIKIHEQEMQQQEESFTDINGYKVASEEE